MEIRVEFDDEVAEELAEEATLQGFDDRASYLRWIVANRPMSSLSSTQAPAVASRVSELEERVKLLERQLGLDDPVDPDADLGDGGTGGGDFGGGFESAGDSASLGDVEPSSESVDLEEPASDPELDEDEEEDAAEDDDIAEAIGDVDIDDDDEE